MQLLHPYTPRMQTRVATHPRAWDPYVLLRLTQTYVYLLVSSAKGKKHSPFFP